jgi:hypothetical protein
MKKAFKVLIVLVMIGVVMGLFCYNAGKNMDNSVSEVKGIVLEIDDSNVIESGVSKIGNQFLVVRILAAFAGTLCGLFVTIGVTMFFGNKFELY